MPMTLSIGLSRKLGLPDYGSLGASCNVTVESDAVLLHDDLAAGRFNYRPGWGCSMCDYRDRVCRVWSG